MNPNIQLICNRSTVKYVWSKFPGGEIHVCLENTDKTAGVFFVNASITNSDDIMTILLLKNAIDELNSENTTHLIMPYIPYQQQDRICKKGESFSLKIFANLINSAGFRSVNVFDPHSYVAPSLLDRCVPYSLTDVFKKMDIEDVNEIFKDVDLLIAPDAGSYKKVSEISDYLMIPMIHATKVRKDGEVKIELHGSVKNKTCFVIDDICVGGRTFIELGKQLKKKQSKSNRLYISHGIFSGGLDELNRYYDLIYSTESRPEARKLGEVNKIQIVL